MINIQDTDQIYSWSTHELWEALNLMEENQINEHQTQLTNIKEGYDIKIPIMYIARRWYEMHPENKTVTIKGHGKYDLQQFMDECDERKKNMRNLILELNQKDTITTPRIQNE